MSFVDLQLLTKALNILQLSAILMVFVLAFASFIEVGWRGPVGQVSNIDFSIQRT